MKIRHYSSNVSGETDGFQEICQSLEIIQKIDDAEARRVLYQTIDEHDKSVKRISKALNLREETIKQSIQKLKSAFKTEYFE